MQPSSASRSANAAESALSRTSKRLFVNLLELLNLAFGEQLAAAEHDDVIAHRLDVRQHVAGKDQVHALVVGQVAGQFEHFLPAGRVHAVGRFVEDQQLRIVDDGRRQLEPLLHAGGIGLHFAIAGFAEPDVVEHLVRPLQRVVGRHAHQFAGVGDELHALRRAETGTRPRAQSRLRGGYRAAARRKSMPSTSPDAAIDRDQAQQRADHRRLAGAVRPEQPDRARGDGERQIVERPHVAVGLGNVRELK